MAGGRSLDFAEWQEKAIATVEGTLGAGAVDALPQIAKVVGAFSRTLLVDFVPQQPQHPFIVNLAMIMKQAYTDGRYAPPPGAGTPFTDNDVLCKAAHLANFAYAAYSRTEEEMCGRIPGMTEKDIVYVHRSHSVSCPNFFVAIDPTTGDIVLSVRGTASPADALTDMVADATPFLGGEAHAGILRSADQVVHYAKPVLEAELRKSPTKKVVVVGHSLGAGTAILTLLRLFGDGGVLERVVAMSKTTCYAYAPPAVFRPLEELPPFAHDCIYSFVNDVDCIPRAGFSSLAKLAKAMTTVDQMPLTKTQRVAYLAASLSVSLGVHLPDYEEHGDDVPQECKPFYGLGTLLLYYRGADGLPRCDELQPEALDRLLLHPRMVESHKVVAYQQVASEVVANLRRC